MCFRSTYLSHFRPNLRHEDILADERGFQRDFAGRLSCIALVHTTMSIQVLRHFRSSSISATILQAACFIPTATLKLPTSKYTPNTHQHLRRRRYASPVTPPSSAKNTVYSNSTVSQLSGIDKNPLAPAQLGPRSHITEQALDLIALQPSHFAIVEIKGRPYHVHVDDVIITMRMNEVKLGDVLILDRVREIGSAEYLLRGNPYVHPEYHTIKVVVVEHPIGKPIVRKHWKKRGHDKIVVNTNSHTALRVAGIEINTVSRKSLPAPVS
ncbi:hypothetical protein SeMB42_g01321 [Synchytrium endobioticum]|uniref:Large ribosomal subunit protein bL21m n=1 Tax=Synchytrium endobioticum TaxID=286115 RepID=A0A507DLQ9_9FUNG|nr:hypothetical protein SeMB42_g01321 [Synchytrium endobioticum]